MRNFIGRRILMFFILSALLIVFTGIHNPASAKKSDPSAMITHTKGVVKRHVKGGNGWSTAGVLTELSCGDMILIKPGGMARIVFYRDTHSEILKGPCKVRIGSRCCVLKNGKKGRIRVLPSYRGIRAFKSIEASSAKFAGVEARNRPDIVFVLSPREFIAELKPAYEWEAVNGADGYIIRLENLQGRELWNVSSKSAKINYPKNQSPLDFNSSYFCDVRAVKENKVIARGSSAFKILPGDKVKKIRILKQQANKQLKENPDDPTPLVALLTIYMENRVLDGAFDTCSRLIKMRPDDKNIHYWMGRLYELKGMKDKANKEYGKAGIK